MTSRKLGRLNMTDRWREKTDEGCEKALPEMFLRFSRLAILRPLRIHFAAFA